MSHVNNIATIQHHVLSASPCTQICEISRVHQTKQEDLTMKKRMNILLALFTSMTILVSSITGCGKTDTSVKAEEKNAQTATEQTKASTTVTENYDMVKVTYDEEDTDTAWDEGAATKVTCADDKVTIDGEGVSETDGIITISKAGTYVFSGTLKEGQISVNAGKEDMVHIILNGLTLTSSTSAAINGIQSEKVILTLADGTTNEVTDASEYKEVDETEEPNAAIFSKDDISINGKGTLKVNGNYQDGIRSKDDLIIVSGTLNVTAKQDGLKGKDSVVVKEADITVDSGEDGIKANNDTETEKGYVVLEGGNYKITSKNDGIQAQTVLQVTGGTYDIKTGDGSESTIDDHQETFGGGFGGGNRGQMPSGDMGTPPEGMEDMPSGFPEDLPENMPSGVPEDMPEGMTPPSGDAATGERPARPSRNEDTQQSEVSASDGDTSSTDKQDTDATSGATAEGSTDTATTDTESDSMKAFKGYAAVFITGGTISVDSADDAVHSNGDVTVTAGTLTLNSGDDAIHANSNLKIEGGNLDIPRSYEGLEGQTIDITSGTIKLVANDDGINASGGNDSSGSQGGGDQFAADEDAYIRITDGQISVDASGDGIDSNGSVFVDGGTTLVSGPTNSGNGAFDYNGTAQITGGTLIAAGSAGMALNFSEESTQNSMLVYYSEAQAADTLLNLSDAEGNSLASFAPSKEYQTVVISTPDIKSDTTYAISSGGTITGEATNGYYGNQAYSGGTKLYDIKVESTITTGGDETAQQNTMGSFGKGGGGRGQRPSEETNTEQDTSSDSENTETNQIDAATEQTI